MPHCKDFGSEGKFSLYVLWNKINDKCDIELYPFYPQKEWRVSRWEHSFAGIRGNSIRFRFKLISESDSKIHVILHSKSRHHKKEADVGDSKEPISKRSSFVNLKHASKFGKGNSTNQIAFQLQNLGGDQLYQTKWAEMKIAKPVTIRGQFDYFIVPTIKYPSKKKYVLSVYSKHNFVLFPEYT